MSYQKKYADLIKKIIANIQSKQVIDQQYETQGVSGMNPDVTIPQDQLQSAVGLNSSNPAIAGLNGPSGNISNFLPSGNNQQPAQQQTPQTQMPPQQPQQPQPQMQQ